MATESSTRQTASQFIKYVIVGGINTLVTLAVIFLLKSVASVNPYIANAAGYAAGLVNSFLWNRIWVFHSAGERKREATRFMAGFACCYLLQLLIVWGLSTQTGLNGLLIHIPLNGIPFQHDEFTLSGYGIATITGMAVYTIANFLYNRLITFR